MFRSSRDGGGLHEIPALGREVRLIAKNRFDPRYSPDGSEVAYWVGAQNIAVTVPGSGEVWVVPVSGGEPRRVGQDASSRLPPIARGEIAIPLVERTGNLWLMSRSGP